MSKTEAKAEPLLAQKIKNFLPQQLKGAEICVLNTVESTNTYAKELARSGAAAGTMVLAEAQTAGRGRQGKSFFSPASTGLYMSIVLRPEELSGDTQLITVAAAVAVCRALEALTECEVQIKWVNDVYCGGRKLCGILCEALLDDAGKIAAVIAGIGVNCTTRDFPAELSESAGALETEISRNELAAEIASQLFSALSMDSAGLLDEYRSRSLMNGKRVRFTQCGETLEATACGIADNGNLLVRLESGEVRSLGSGEVSVKGLSAWK